MPDNQPSTSNLSSTSTDTTTQVFTGATTTDNGAKVTDTSSTLETTQSFSPIGSLNKEAPPAPAPEYNFSQTSETQPTPEPVDAHQSEVQELETSIDAYIKKTADRSRSYKDTITLGTDQTALPNDQYQSQPSIILPITQEQEKKGQHQSPLTGLRWLVEWSKKLMKKFAGRFIYKKAPALDISATTPSNPAPEPEFTTSPRPDTSSITMNTPTMSAPDSSSTPEINSSPAITNTITPTPTPSSAPTPNTSPLETSIAP